MATNIPNATTDLSSLRSAICDHDIDQIKQILQDTPIIPQVDLNRALSFATQKTKVEAIKVLMSQGAQVNENAFYFACSKHNVAIFEALLEFGWDINSVEFGEPALRYASSPWLWISH